MISFAHHIIVLINFQVGSPEWLLFQKLMSEGGNLVESMMTLRRLKEEEKRQARLAYRRALEQKRRRQKDEKFKMKLERMKAESRLRENASKIVETI